MKNFHQTADTLVLLCPSTVINRILIMTSIPPTVIPTVTGSRNQIVANTTLTTGSSIDTKDAVDAPSES